MSKCLHPCLQLAAVTLLLYLTLKGVSPKPLDNLITKANEDLNDIQEHWRNLLNNTYPRRNFRNEDLTVDGDNVECNLTRLPCVIHALEVAQIYTHFLEGPNEPFDETKCTNKQTGQQHGIVSQFIGDLITHLKAMMRQPTFTLLNSTSVTCQVICDGDSVQFFNRVEVSLRDAKAVLHKC